MTARKTWRRSTRAAKQRSSVRGTNTFSGLSNSRRGRHAYRASDWSPNNNNLSWGWRRNLSFLLLVRLVGICFFSHLRQGGVGRKNTKGGARIVSRKCCTRHAYNLHSHCIQSEIVSGALNAHVVFVSGDCGSADQVKGFHFQSTRKAASS